MVTPPSVQHSVSTLAMSVRVNGALNFVEVFQLIRHFRKKKHSTPSYGVKLRCARINAHTENCKLLSVWCILV